MRRPIPPNHVLTSVKLPLYHWSHFHYIYCFRDAAELVPASSGALSEPLPLLPIRSTFSGAFSCAELCCFILYDRVHTSSGTA